MRGATVRTAACGTVAPSLRLGVANEPEPDQDVLEVMERA